MKNSGELDIYWRKSRKISKSKKVRRRKTWSRTENWTYIEERQGKYPKERMQGEERREIEVKIGYILKKDKKNIQKKRC